MTIFSRSQPVSLSPVGTRFGTVRAGTASRSADAHALRLSCGEPGSLSHAEPTCTR